MALVGLNVVRAGVLAEREVHYIQVEAITQIAPSGIEGYSRIYTFGPVDSGELGNYAPYFLVPYTMEELVAILKVMSVSVRGFPPKQGAQLATSQDESA